MDAREGPRHDHPMAERLSRDHAAALGRARARTLVAPATPYDRLRDRQRRRSQR
ncbi:hypothetical protein [Streptomyces sp. NPDC052107]|uniref:hypothetical protein n=1 Tax=Streptomyces sp. NPDC052107 TaxID=3155632 RepID=UPI00342EEAE8